MYLLYYLFSHLPFSKFSFCDHVNDKLSDCKTFFYKLQWSVYRQPDSVFTVVKHVYSRSVCYMNILFEAVTVSKLVNTVANPTQVYVTLLDWTYFCQFCQFYLNFLPSNYLLEYALQFFIFEFCITFLILYSVLYLQIIL